MWMQPTPHVPDEFIRVGFKLQRVMGDGVFDDLLVRGGKLGDEVAGPIVADDAILAGKQHQDGNVNVFGRESQIAVEPNAFDEQSSRGLVQAQWIVAQKLLPARRGGE